jgi:two-component system, cell cycle response regulator
VIGGEQISRVIGPVPGLKRTPGRADGVGVISPPAATDERTPALPSAVGDPRAAALLATVVELEMLARFDRGSAEQRAERAVATARELGLTELEQRAQLVKADLLRRRGNVAEAGRIAQDVHRWATDNDSRRTLARSHFVLSAVFQELGDVSLALEHSVRSVDLLDEDADPAMRVDHLTRLGDCLALNGDEAARERYLQVQLVAEELGDVDRRLMVLNNRAYSETLWGDFEAALHYSLQLQAAAAAHGVPLHIGRLDTVARALMGLDRLAEAEEAMLPGLRPEALAASLDGDAGADFLLTLAEIRRRRGNVAGAQESLDESVRRCEEHGLTSIRVRARREQSELHAAGGDFRAAFEEHKRYVHDLMELQSAQRDARARALQAMYETTEARRQSRRYRELSLRDPLTGLYNRRYVDEQLPRLLRRAADGPPVTVALLDLDYFKLVNDTCSHEVGDDVLRTVAELLEDSDSAHGYDSGAGSFVARMGGEEFLLVLVGCSPPEASRHLDDVRRAVASYPWSDLTGALPVTVSIGAAGTDGLPEPTPAELLGLADAHLYRAKHEGRNRVVTGD